MTTIPLTPEILNEETGFYILPKRFINHNPDDSYSEMQQKNGVVVGIIGPGTTKRYMNVVLFLHVENKTGDDIVINPNGITVLDGRNVMLQIFDIKSVAHNIEQAAARRYVAYDQNSQAQVAAAAQAPTGYTILGSSRTRGQGEFELRRNRGTLDYSGTFDYSGSASSNYQVIPQANYALLGAQLGRAVGMFFAGKSLERSQDKAELIYRHAFEYGAIPPNVARRGAMMCQAPAVYPLQIRISVSGNEYSFKFDDPPQTMNN
jgi:hypothetical protein